MTEKLLIFLKAHFIAGIIFIDRHFSGIPQDESGVIFNDGYLSETASIYNWKMTQEYWNGILPSSLLLEVQWEFNGESLKKLNFSIRY